MSASLDFSFQNLCGTAYTGGSVAFSADGSCLFAPISNRVSVVDLSTSRSSTLKTESRSSVDRIALSNDGRLAFVVDVDGYGRLVSLERGTDLHWMNVKERVGAASFSPDDRFLAICAGRTLSIWLTASAATCWQFILFKRFVGHTDSITHVDWSSCSRSVVTSGSDSIVRVWSIFKESGEDTPSLGENEGAPNAGIFVDQLQAVRGSFFSSNGKDVFSVSRTGFLLHWQANSEGWRVASRAQLEVNGAVTAVAFDRSSSVLVVGVSSGAFSLFELPSLAALQSFTVGGAVTSLALANGGDWVGVGVAEAGQLMVWEWKAESFLFKQQGHHGGVTCVAYSENSGKANLKANTTGVASNSSDLLETFNSASPFTAGGGGVLLATGGVEGKVKLWHTLSGFCFATFAEHTASVEAVTFTQNGNALISASLDGSVRAYDLMRYRNFRTMTAPSAAVQFGSVAVDSSGDIVAAGAASGSYSVYLWALRTGQLLDELSGHESRVSHLCFGGADGLLATSSWDKTLKVWNLFGRENKGGAPESLVQQSHVTCCAFDPSESGVLAAATLMGKIVFWDAKSGNEVGAIDGIRDIVTGRKASDKFAPGALKGGKSKRDGTGKEINLNQFYSNIAYSGSSGALLIAASENSAFVSLYDTNLKQLITRVQLTNHFGLSGVKPFLNSKQDTEGGFDGGVEDGWDVMDPVAKRLARKRAAAGLPGVGQGEMAMKSKMKNFKVFSIAASKDGSQFSVGSSEGAYIFSLGGGGVVGTVLEKFRPKILAKSVSAGEVSSAVSEGNFGRALALALALNDYHAIRYVFERIPLTQVTTVLGAGVPRELLLPLVSFLSFALHPNRGLPHIEGLLVWVELLFNNHYAIVQEEMHATGDLRGVVCSLIQNVSAHMGHLGALIRGNASTLAFLASASH